MKLIIFLFVAFFIDAISDEHTYTHTYTRKHKQSYIVFYMHNNKKINKSYLQFIVHDQYAFSTFKTTWQPDKIHCNVNADTNLRFNSRFK